MTPGGYTEDALIEQPAIALLGELGWETVNAYHEFNQGVSALGRETRAEVVLTARLRPALHCSGCCRQNDMCIGQEPSIRQPIRKRGVYE